MVLERPVHSTSDLQRSDLLALTGLPEDVMTFWLRKDLIEPIGGKTGIKGKKLLFPYYEANIIAVLLQLRLFGANIEALKGIASIYRTAIAWGTSHGLTNRESLYVSQAASAVIGHESEYLDGYAELNDRYRSEQAGLISDMEADGIDFERKISPVLKTLTRSQYINEAISYGEITAQPINDQSPHATFFWPTSAGWKRGTGKGGLSRAKGQGSFAYMAIDVFGILYNVWNKVPDEPSRSKIDLKPAR